MPLPSPGQPAGPLIEALGDPDVDVRTRAHQALRRMLPWVEPELRANLAHRDAEVASRCRTLLEPFDRKPPPQKILSGKIALSDPKSGRIAVDVRARDGVQIGDRFEACRFGTRIGWLIVVDVQVWGSWVKPEDAPIDAFRKGDVIEARVER